MPQPWRVILGLVAVVAASQVPVDGNCDAYKTKDFCKAKNWVAQESAVTSLTALSGLCKDKATAVVSQKSAVAGGLDNESSRGFVCSENVNKLLSECQGKWTSFSSDQSTQFLQSLKKLPPQLSRHHNWFRYSHTQQIHAQTDVPVNMVDLSTAGLASAEWCALPTTFSVDGKPNKQGISRWNVGERKYIEVFSRADGGTDGCQLSARHVKAPTSFTEPFAADLSLNKRLGLFQGQAYLFIVKTNPAETTGQPALDQLTVETLENNGHSGRGVSIELVFPTFHDDNASYHTLPLSVRLMPKQAVDLALSPIDFTWLSRCGVSVVVIDKLLPPGVLNGERLTRLVQNGHVNFPREHPPAVLVLDVPAGVIKPDSMLSAVRKELQQQVKTATKGSAESRFYQRIYSGLYISNQILVIKRAEVGAQSTLETQARQLWLDRVNSDPSANPTAIRPWQPLAQSTVSDNHGVLLVTDLELGHVRIPYAGNLLSTAGLQSIGRLDQLARLTKAFKEQYRRRVALGKGLRPIDVDMSKYQQPPSCDLIFFLSSPWIHFFHAAGFAVDRLSETSPEGGQDAQKFTVQLPDGEVKLQIRLFQTPLTGRSSEEFQVTKVLGGNIKSLDDNKCLIWSSPDFQSSASAASGLSVFHSVAVNVPAKAKEWLHALRSDRVDQRAQTVEFYLHFVVLEDNLMRVKGSDGKWALPSPKPGTNPRRASLPYFQEPVPMAYWPLALASLQSFAGMPSVAVNQAGAHRFANPYCSAMYSTFAAGVNPLVYDKASWLISTTAALRREIDRALRLAETSLSDMQKQQIAGSGEAAIAQLTQSAQNLQQIKTQFDALTRTMQFTGSVSASKLKTAVADFERLRSQPLPLDLFRALDRASGGRFGLEREILKAQQEQSRLAWPPAWLTEIVTQEGRGKTPSAAESVHLTFEGTLPEGVDNWSPTATKSNLWLPPTYFETPVDWRNPVQWGYGLHIPPSSKLIQTAVSQEQLEAALPFAVQCYDISDQLSASFSEGFAGWALHTAFRFKAALQTDTQLAANVIDQDLAPAFPLRLAAAPSFFSS